MQQRFQQMYVCKEEKSFEGCDITMLAYAVLWDTKEEKSILQLKWKNNASLMIKSVSITAEIKNQENIAEVKHVYNMPVAPGGVFGVQEPIELPFCCDTSITFRVDDVQYEGESVIRKEQKRPSILRRCVRWGVASVLVIVFALAVMCAENLIPVFGNVTTLQKLNREGKLDYLIEELPEGIQYSVTGNDILCLYRCEDAMYKSKSELDGFGEYLEDEYYGRDSDFTGEIKVLERRTRIRGITITLRWIDAKSNVEIYSMQWDRNGRVY